MDDFSKPPRQSSVLDQFDLDPIDQAMDEQCSQRQQPVKSVAPQTRHSRPKVVAISAIPVIDTAIAIDSEDRDILDIPILTSPYRTSGANNFTGNTAQPSAVQDAKAS